MLSQIIAVRGFFATADCQLSAAYRIKRVSAIGRRSLNSESFGDSGGKYVTDAVRAVVDIDFFR